MLGSDLYSFFSSFPEMKALIGNSSSLRFYPDVAPVDTTIPFIVYQTVGGSAGLNLDGDDSTREERIRFHISAKYTGMIREIKELMERILHGNVLKIGKYSDVVPVFISENSVYDDDPEIYRQVIDYKFSYSKGE